MSDQEPDTSREPIVKDAAAIRVFPPGIPLATVLIGVVLQRFWPIGAGFALHTPLRYWIGGAIIVLSVYALGFRSISAMRRTGQSENPYTETTEILEAGPYRFTRNPMYLQMVLACIGFAVLLSNFWILLLTPVCALVLHYLVIIPEESYLERKFGEPYLAYKNQVRRWI